MSHLLETTVRANDTIGNLGRLHFAREHTEHIERKYAKSQSAIPIPLVQKIRLVNPARGVAREISEGRIAISESGVECRRSELRVGDDVGFI